MLKSPILVLESDFSANKVLKPISSSLKKGDDTSSPFHPTRVLRGAKEAMDVKGFDNGQVLSLRLV